MSKLESGDTGKLSIPWDDAKVAQLKALWPVMSSALIAAHLGYPGARSAVIGKANRLRLEGPRTKAMQVKESIALPKSQPMPKLRKAAPPNQPVHLFEVQPGQCRWIVTPHNKPFDEMRYCGGHAVPGRSYCEAHLKLAHDR